MLTEIYLYKMIDTVYKDYLEKCIAMLLLIAYTPPMTKPITKLMAKLFIGITKRKQGQPTKSSIKREKKV